MGNLDLWEKFRVVPPEAQKAIGGGRLKGMTDINPMFRLKCLTEQFGVCGVGWKYTITKQWLEEGADGVQSAFVNIDLYHKCNGEWSEAVPGTGGSGFVDKEFKGLYTSDECFKMALTDAISVACKALGMGADVYWNKDTTKYNKQSDEALKDAKEEAAAMKNVMTVEQAAALKITFGEYTSKSLGEIYKTDIECIKQIVKECGDETVLKAIGVLKVAVNSVHKI